MYKDITISHIGKLDAVEEGEDDYCTRPCDFVRCLSGPGERVVSRSLTIIFQEEFMLGEMATQTMKEIDFETRLMQYQVDSTQMHCLTGKRSLVNKGNTIQALFKSTYCLLCPRKNQTALLHRSCNIQTHFVSNCPRLHNGCRDCQ